VRQDGFSGVRSCASAEADEPVTVRFKAGGMLHIVGRNGGRKLKKIWQECNVPPWLRDTTPLLFYGETLIAAAGFSSRKRDGQKRGSVLSGKA
jgi:tRNA(Ile)-lysidine synthase